MITPESLTSVTVPMRKTASVRVDFRGRVTMVNDEAEELFGLSRELLYSRPFTDFIAEIDRPGIAQLVKQRHLQIESSLDLGPITFVSHVGKTQPIRLLISIGYAAGNPANYHIILLPTSGIEIVTPSSKICGEEFVVTEQEKSHEQGQLIELLAQYAQSDFPESAATVSKFLALTTPLQQNAVYRFDGTSMICLAASTVGMKGRAAETDESELSPTNRLHELVCQSRELYRHDQDASVRRAVELTGSAPQELILPIVTDAATFCVRGWFKESPSVEVLDEICRLIPNLILHSRQTVASHGDHQNEWKLITEGHSEVSSHNDATLPLQWYRFNANGTCISRSSVAIEMENVASLCKSFGELQSVELAAKLDLFRVATRPGSTIEKIFTLCESGDQLFGWVEGNNILGVMVVGGASTNDAHPSQISLALPSALHRELSQAFKPLRATASRVLHQYLNKLDADGQFLMTRLDEQLEGCDRLLRVTAQLQRLAAEQETSVPVDLAFLLRRKAHDIALSLSCEEPTISFEHPRKISSSLHKCEAMIDGVVQAMFRESRNPKRILVSLEELENRFSLLMRFPELKSDERAIKQLMSLHRGFHDQIRTGHGKLEHLSFVRVIAHSLGGELHATLGSHSELCLTLTIPKTLTKN
jgi:PAS domain S-box-containing protein